MRDTQQSTRDRLRASELLARAEGHFLTRVQAESAAHVDLTAAVRLALLERDAKKSHEDGQEYSEYSS